MQTIGEVISHIDWIRGYQIEEKKHIEETREPIEPMEKTVTVAFVNPPRGNSKSHSIKTTDGEYLGFYADKLHFEKGATYRLLVEERNVNGRVYLNATRIIEERKPVATASGAPAGNERWWMPFVSNTVAHALQCGQITDPTMVKVWAAAAKEAAMELDAEIVKPRDIAPVDEDPPY